MEWIIGIGKEVTAPLVVGLLAWMIQNWRLGRKAAALQEQCKEFVTKAEFEAFQAQLACELAAGNERMDVSAEVDAFVVTWLPVMCEALEVKPVDCQAMKTAATALLTKTLNAGRVSRGGQQGGNHAR
jgi:hypothetical protein